MTQSLTGLRPTFLCLAVTLFASACAPIQDRAIPGKVVLETARRDLGRNPTGRTYLWCAHWLNQTERKLGRPGIDTGFAAGFKKYGQRVAPKQAEPGDIVVVKIKGGYHVGYFVTWDTGNVRLISGNSGGRGPGQRVVSESRYPISNVVAVQRVM